MELGGTNAYSPRAIDPRHVDVLDGIRAYAILLVAWFHLWQQSWLMPIIEAPFLRPLAANGVISLDSIPRGGYIFVDMLLFLSAFCLFLPHARAMLLGEPAPGCRDFFRKRLARIVPSYYFAVLVIFFCFSLPTGAYVSARDALTDLFSTLTFTQTFFPGVLLGTKIDGVLWTAAIEMQFYLVFPLLALCFRKRPILTYLGMVGISMLYLFGFAVKDPDRLRITLNQLPGFFGVFSNGFLFAYLYVWLSKRLSRSAPLSIAGTMAACVCLYLIFRLEKSVSAVNPVQLWQATYRYRLSLLFAIFCVSAAVSARWFRFLFSNAIARFLALISYNLYIWHQWIFVKLKEWRVPYWSGDTAPNFTGDKAWQWEYTVIALCVSIAVAVLVTYAIERPAARLLQKNRKGPHPYASSLQDA